MRVPGLTAGDAPAGRERTPMTQPIYERFAQRVADEFGDEWRQHVAPHFRHLTPAINPTQEAPMPTLAEITADARTQLEAAETPLRTLLDQHLPQLEQLGHLVATNPVFVSAAAALHVPPPVLEGVAALLDHYAAAYPKDAQPAA